MNVKNRHENTHPFCGRVKIEGFSSFSNVYYKTVSRTYYNIWVSFCVSFRISEKIERKQ